MAANSPWRVRLSDPARNDLREIFAWTLKTFGPKQTRTYREVIFAALDELKTGPDPNGARRRDDVETGLRLLQVGRKGRPGRHFIAFAVDGERRIVVSRILHDSMDLKRHLPTDLQEGSAVCQP